MGKRIEDVPVVRLLIKLSPEFTHLNSGSEVTQEGRLPQLKSDVPSVPVAPSCALNNEAEQVTNINIK
jgi:hypothetical protein